MDVPNGSFLKQSSDFFLFSFFERFFINLSNIIFSYRLFSPLLTECNHLHIMNIKTAHE